VSRTLATRSTVIAMACLFAVILAAGLYRIAQRRTLIRLGYELSEVSSELRTLEEEERRLRLELSVLSSPVRIERLAVELGMIRPSPSEVRVLSRTGEGTP
jgi:cell division protein FtsL